jgi:catechol 2,3-dioxygenase-like lactoylglutathione lyase family enzyme
MKQHMSVITLGVRDMNRAKKFYGEGLGWAVHHESPGYWLSFSLNNKSLELGFTPWDALASDAGSSKDGSGFRGLTLSYVVSSKTRVDEVLEEAKRAGGNVAKAPSETHGYYSGYFADPEGYLWKVVTGPGMDAFVAE